MILFLSVARDLVSLWDTEEDRNKGALTGEIYVNLQLTVQQRYILETAKRASTVDNRTSGR